MAIPTSTSSQSTRPGQSRLQRPASYHEKAQATTSNPQVLKPPSGTSRGASSPTRLPLYSQHGPSEKKNLAPQREPLSASRIANAPQSTRKATPTNRSQDGPSISLAAAAVKEEPEDAEKSAAIASQQQDGSATRQTKPATDSGDGTQKVPQEQIESPEGRATSVRAPSAPNQSGTRTLRSQSLRKPTSSTSSMAPPPKPASHSRHVSSTSTIGSTRSSRVSSAETKAPKQSSGETPKDAPGRSSRAPSATHAQNRPIGTRAKLDQQRISSLSTTREAKAPNPAARRDISDSAPRLTRPAFSTLQRHFSPRKTTKAPTSAFIHPSPDTTPSAPSLDTLRLQTELLHLSLLHEAALSTSAQYRTSALSALENHYAAVSAAHTRMRATERDMQARVNLLALREWTSGNTSLGLSENIQLLSALLKELPRLTEAGGRVTSLVDAFEMWMAHVEQVWRVRDAEAEQGQDADEDSDAEIEFIDGLGGEWSAENAALTRRLTALSHDADMLMDAKPGSSVAALVDGCKALLRGTLDELIAMTKIEADVVKREKVWVQEKLEGIDFAAVV